jgi:hypothetical protein
LTNRRLALEAPQTGGGVWTPGDAQLRGLGPEGAALVERLRQHYEFSPVEGELLIEAGITADRLDELRQLRAGPDVDGKRRLALDKDEQMFVKQYSALLGLLRLRP